MEHKPYHRLTAHHTGPSGSMQVRGALQRSSCCKRSNIICNKCLHKPKKIHCIGGSAGRLQIIQQNLGSTYRPKNLFLHWWICRTAASQPLRRPSAQLRHSPSSLVCPPQSDIRTSHNIRSLHMSPTPHNHLCRPPTSRTTLRLFRHGLRMVRM